ncbi:MFS transporter [Dasania sp. GY-MA-18]|uniref:MFS transporter n=1 Tax=Dasania phycosphaerae TaxID=2950436 RepID=A0A9J6RJ66_9GAMM|nr:MULTISPECIES: MFS transporter [Dasania]MCR8921989.1 MFS transporter [Dasania sp. GY-MA-18]MCZ0864417.1 MFS transporter [Dasania phycosphaerae]MCZ0868145.1 MFS transporter [Dasania phycosphaerae]
MIKRLFAQLPTSVWLLVLAYALMNSGGSLVVFIASLIATHIAPSQDQATLPVALMIVGVACSAIPLGKLQTRYGRKKVFLGFAVLACGSALLSALSLWDKNFYQFCAATFLMGFTMASAHQYRFAVIEHAGVAQAATVTSILLLGGLLSAFIGPEIALLGKSLIAYDFIGSYLLLAIIFALCVLLLAFTRDSPVSNLASDLSPSTHSGWQLILRSPILLLALLSSVVAYMVMSFIMTATPLTMHQHMGHSLDHTKLVIQSHIAAMYLPSLLAGLLIRRCGFRWVLWPGLMTFLICVVIAMYNNHFIHFWLALVLLGIGWNFLFIAGTTLLPMGHNHEDRFKVQATNDFILFTCQAIAALSSGWFLYHYQWQGVLLMTLPLLLFYLFFLWRSTAFPLIKAANN